VAENGSGRFEAKGCLAGKRVEGVERVSKGVCPERFRDFGLEKRAANHVADGPVCAFCYSVQFRGVRRARIMADTRFFKVRLENIGHVFTAIVCAQRADYVSATFLKEGLENLKHQKESFLDFIG
jgi:hypothetical protein